MIPIALKKVLWMVIMIHGDVAGVFLNEPVPPYMTFDECEASSLMHSMSTEAVARGATYKCVWEYGRPLNTGRYWRPME